MKKAYITFMMIIITLTLCSCSLQNSQLLTFNNPLEKQLNTSLKIVYTNVKERTLKFTVADPKVIPQISSIVSKGRVISNAPTAKPDYEIVFYLQNGKQVVFDYWMSASANGQDVNLKDDQGVYYGISESLDTYIINSTKMFQRPSNFADLYSKCLSYSISLLEKSKDGDTVVGVDTKSDRRMRRYTISYEEEGLFNNIKAEGYTILPFSDGGKYTYAVTYVTDIYNPDKAQITVETVKVADQTKQTFIFKCGLAENTWTVSKEQ